MLSWLRRVWVLLLAVVCGMLIIDASQMILAVYSLSAVALVLLLADALFAAKAKWGLFPTLDIDEAIKTAQSTPLGSALVWLGFVALLATILFLVVPSGARAENLPAGARQHLPVLAAAVEQHWPGAPLAQIMAGQVEQESGWKERATLKTSRELGRGLVQLTIAYRADGSERFNAYRDLSGKTFAAWDWRNDPYNVRYQLTYLTLRDKGDFTAMRRLMVNDAEAWRAALVCYNAGKGRVLQRRAQAKLAGLPADRWQGGLDRAYTRGEAALLYGRPLYQAVNEYPVVIFKRSAKYAGLI